MHTEISTRLLQLEQSVASTILHLNDTHSSTLFCFFIGDRRTSNSRSLLPYSDNDANSSSSRSSGTRTCTSTSSINDSVLVVKLISRDYQLASFNHTSASTADGIDAARTSIGHSLLKQGEVTRRTAASSNASTIDGKMQHIHAMSLKPALRVSFHVGQMFDKKHRSILPAATGAALSRTSSDEKDRIDEKQKVNKLKQKKLQMAAGVQGTSFSTQNINTNTPRDSGLFLSGAETRVPLQAWQFKSLCNILEIKSRWCYNMKGVGQKKKNEEKYPENKCTTSNTTSSFSSTTEGYIPSALLL